MDLHDFQCLLQYLKSALVAFLCDEGHFSALQLSGKLICTCVKVKQEEIK